MNPNDIAERLERYLAARAKMRQIDPEEIHGLHIGDPREVVLTATDLRKAAQALRRMGEALEKIIAREEIYMRKREAADPFEEPSENPWDRYAFAVEVCDHIGAIAQAALNPGGGAT